MSQRFQEIQKTTTYTRSSLSVQQPSKVATTTPKASELDIPDYQTRTRYDKNDLIATLLPVQNSQAEQQPDIVMFFMAVEIERLLAENTQLKTELKNQSDTSLDRVGYEMQIRDLMDQIKSRKNTIEKLTIDNQKLVRLLNDMELDLQDVEGRYNNQQNLMNVINQSFGGRDPKDIQKELNDLRQKADALEEMKDNQRENEDAVADLNHQMDETDKENEDLKNQLGDLEKQLADLLKKLNAADQKILNLNKQADKNKNDADKLAEKNKNDSDRQKQANQDLGSQMNTLKQSTSNLPQLEDELARLRTQFANLQEENARLRRENDMLRAQLRDMENKFNNMVNDYEDKLRRLQDQINKLMDQLQKAKDDAQRAKDALERALDQNKGLQDQIKQKDSQINTINREINELHQDNDQLQQAQQQLQDQVLDTQDQQGEINRLLALIESQRDKIFQLESKFKQYALMEEKLRAQDSRISLLMAEIERLNNLLRQITQDAEEQKQKYARLELSILEYRQMEMTNRDAASKAALLAQEVERLKQLLLRKQQELEDQKNIVNDLNQDKADLEGEQNVKTDILIRYLLIVAENERLTTLLAQVQDQFKTMKYQMEQLLDKYEQLVQEYETMKNQFEALQNKTQGINFDDYEALKRKILEYENKLALLSMDNNRMRSSQNSTSRLLSPSMNQMDTLTSPQMSSSKETRYAGKIQDLLCLIVMMSAELDILREKNDIVELTQPQQQLQSTTYQKTTTRTSQQSSSQVVGRK